MRLSIAVGASLLAAGTVSAGMPACAHGEQAPRQVAMSRHTCTAAYRIQNRGYFHTPMSDGIPGFKDYVLGVRALCRRDGANAVHMFKLAAFWGYARAAYSLGVMYFNGQSVPVDKPLGAAWMILAAAPGNPSGNVAYAKVRDLMVTALTDAQFSETDRLWARLRKTYGDKVALQRADAQWQYAITAETGSHLGHPIAPVSAYVPEVGSGNAAAAAGLGGVGVGAAATPMTGQYHAMHDAAGPYQALEKYVTGKVTVGPLGLQSQGGSGNGEPVPATSGAGAHAKQGRPGGPGRSARRTPPSSPSSAG